MAFFFFNDTATTEIYTLSLHDALPIYVAGFRWGRARGYDVLVEMDADCSHHPEQLPGLLAALADADLVLGSRYVPGGRVEDWPRHRLLLDRKSTRLNSSHANISYAVFCLKKK